MSDSGPRLQVDDVVVLVRDVPGRPHLVAGLRGLVIVPPDPDSRWCSTPRHDLLYTYLSHRWQTKAVAGR